MKKNTVKEKLAAGNTSVGTMVLEFNTPGIAKILQEAGTEFIIYDMEHGGIGIDSIRQLMSYNRGLETIPLVRVPDTEYAYIARALDIGAMGLMIPMVESKEQVEQIIAASKYPPLGKRGTAFNIAHDEFVPGSPVEKMQSSNDETLILAQIETQAGLDHLEEIVSAEGVDVAFVGTMDLSTSLGVPGQLDHPLVIEAMERVAEVCQKYGKSAGCFFTSVADAIRWKEKGYTCICYSADILVFQNAFKKEIAEINQG